MQPESAALDPDAMLDERQVAETLNLSVFTLQRWRVKGRGPAFAKLGSAVRYRRGDVDAWLRANSFTSTSEATVAGH